MREDDAATAGARPPAMEGPRPGDGPIFRAVWASIAAPTHDSGGARTA